MFSRKDLARRDRASRLKFKDATFKRTTAAASDQPSPKEVSASIAPPPGA